MMKGNSSCHVPNDAYRDRYDRIFRGGDSSMAEFMAVNQGGAGENTVRYPRGPLTIEQFVEVNNNIVEAGWLSAEWYGTEYATVVLDEGMILHYTNMPANKCIQPVVGSDYPVGNNKDCVK